MNTAINTLVSPDVIEIPMTKTDLTPESSNVFDSDSDYIKTCKKDLTSTNNRDYKPIKLHCVRLLTINIVGGRWNITPYNGNSGPDTAREV